MKDEAQALLNELKPREKEVMKLRYLDELEYNEIAEILKESESNIRQIVSRSLHVLRNRLAPGRAVEPKGRPARAAKPKLKQGEE